MRFNKLNRRTLGAQTSQNFQTSRDFVKFNVTSFNDGSFNNWASRNKFIEETKNRQLRVKKRKSVIEEESHKKRVLQHFKWSLVKFVRSKKLSQKKVELTYASIARKWCIHISSRIILAQAFAKLMKSIHMLKLHKQKEHIGLLIATRWSSYI